MKKTELREKINETKSATKSALQTVYDALNQGQKKKIIKNDAVKKLFDLYGVDYSA